VLNKSVEQRRTGRARNFSRPKTTLDFDDVMNIALESVYPCAMYVIDSEEPRHHIYECSMKPFRRNEEDLVAMNLITPVSCTGSTTFPLGLTTEKAQFDTRTVD